ncbi:MAG: argininosuccinate lyase [Candidatus Omnitrophica bacterium]|nr:argininosuccinate lyase [Candidatus Omnitrophota bacterium]MBU2250797.1 argininosuccinate lyase [Candidatus Omnitrophota bacterium]MBU2473334.1 argininosuccinate lyase [Candidatus Omnitrophota bacterium]
MADKLWGGRFKKEVNKDFFEFQKSIHYDYKVVEYDIYHSIIHVSALEETGLLNKDEAAKLTSALSDIFSEVREGKFKPNLDSEDIHTDIQNRVTKKLGALAQKLHTLRSRNDQVVFDAKWYCYREGLYISSLLNVILANLNHLGNTYRDVFLPGYTHTQRAQVVSFIRYTGAFFCMLERDFERMDAFLKKSSIYIGSGALAGSTIPKEAYSEALKKFLESSRPEPKHSKSYTVKNPLDNVASRDFVIEFLSILSILQMHLSRMAEDFILYSTKEFGFFDLPEEYCTGSSLMPHKKNPDFLELLRGNTGKIYGNLISVLTTMKGLPLTYNRDMQLDKEPLFSSTEVLEQELKIIAGLIKGLKLNKNRIQQALDDEELYATELVEFLVHLGVPFSQAHTAVGKLIRFAEDKKIKIREMSDKELRKFDQHLSQLNIKKIMNPEYAVASKKSLPAQKYSTSKRSPRSK